MKAGEAFAILEQLGLTEHLRDQARNAPPLTTAQVNLVRRLFADAGTTTCPTTTEPRT